MAVLWLAIHRFIQFMDCDKASSFRLSSDCSNIPYLVFLAPFARCRSKRNSLYRLWYFKLFAQRAEIDALQIFSLLLEENESSYQSHLYQKVQIQWSICWLSIPAAWLGSSKRAFSSVSLIRVLLYTLLGSSQVFLSWAECVDGFGLAEDKVSL